jgi:glucan phosphoethanolaminetransferase (alkaline phosphatase superfamily)
MRSPRRAAARIRRVSARSLVLVPALALALLDFALRRSQLSEYTRAAWLGYVGCAAVGALAWGALVVAAARRRSPARWLGRAALATLALLAVGTQLETWARYRSYLNWRTALMGNSLLPCLAQQRCSDRSRVLMLLLAPVVAALGVAVSARRIAPPRRRSARLAFPLGAGALAAAAVFARPDAGWDNGSTPDVLWLSAVGALAKSMLTHQDVMVELRRLPGARSPDPVPPLRAQPARPRDVLLIIDESVRAEEVCSVPAARCDKTPFTNALLPDRIGFTQMRALDSTTTLSLATILSGAAPTEARARLLSAPLLPEYARAAGVDSAFWTSQNLLYANAGRFLDGVPFSAFTSGTALEPYANYLTGADDAKVLDVALTELGRLREPWLSIVQLSNTHFPYVVDEHDLPFSTRLDWRTMDAFGRARVRYDDAVYRQDKLIASFLTRLRGRQGGERAVVVFLSDHGEQLGERGQIGHTWSVYDVEIHVPMWIDAPPGTLTGDEAAHLRALRDTPLTMLEVAPTLLDLLGLWDEASIAAWRRRMSGVSLLRGPPPAGRSVVMTNCSEIFSCPRKNWGAMRGTRKLVATQDEPGGWRCFDVTADPHEEEDLGVAACGDLPGIAEGGGRGTPY